MPNKRDLFEVVGPMVDGRREPSLYVSRDAADMMLAKGIAYSNDDGTRRIYIKSVRARGHNREWRKTRCFDPATGASVSTMQLVPTASIAPANAPLRRFK